MVDLVKRFPMSIWMQKSASIQTRTSLLKIEDHRFCRSQFRSHAEEAGSRLRGGPRGMLWDGTAMDDGRETR